MFHNGVEIDVAQLAGNDRTGFSRTVVIPGVEVGDSIDFALDPTGIGGDPLQPDGDGDRSNVRLIVTRKADPGRRRLPSDIRDDKCRMSAAAPIFASLSK